jgi:hypothetical protein
MRFYVAGGMYQKGDKKEFSLVSPSGNSLPYVWPKDHPKGLDGVTLHNLTKHHASLYRVEQDGKTLTLVRHGETRDNLDPQSHTLDPVQQATVASIIAKALKELAVPEEECPNCQSGTIGLEHNRLVCRGECGHDFGVAPTKEKP